MIYDVYDVTYKSPSQADGSTGKYKHAKAMSAQEKGCILNKGGRMNASTKTMTESTKERMIASTLNITKVSGLDVHEIEPHNSSIIKMQQY